MDESPTPSETATPPTTPISNSPWSNVLVSLAKLGLPNIPIGLVGIAGSLPLLYRSVQLYRHAHFDADVSNIVQNMKHLDANPLQDDAVRRRIGTVVAARALRVATYGTMGGLGVALSSVLLLTQCHSVQQAVEATQRTGRKLRNRLDGVLGMEQTRVDERHPEVVSMRNLSPDEQWNQIVERYFDISNQEEEYRIHQLQQQQEKEKTTE